MLRLTYEFSLHAQIFCANHKYPTLIKSPQIYYKPYQIQIQKLKLKLAIIWYKIKKIYKYIVL